MSDKNTILTEYKDSCDIMDYMDGFCGCCKSKLYVEWHEKNEAYFVRKGLFVIDNLMFLDCDDDEKIKPVRYCFSFDFTNNEFSLFSIINYYNQEKVADFKYERNETDDLNNPKIKILDFNLEKFNRLGSFMNPIIREKLDKSWDIFYKKYNSLPKNKFNEMYKRQSDYADRMLLNFMCEHSVLIINSTMCYYTQQKPEEIKYENFKINTDLEYTTKKQKIKYNYTGYINLNDNKIFKTKINKKLDEDKRAEYQRHIESWSVRGHYRTIKGKKVWIKEHIRGEGVLENRIYGTKPESEVLLIPKIIECERDIKVPLIQNAQTKTQINIKKEAETITTQELSIESKDVPKKKFSIFLFIMSILSFFRKK